MKRTPVILGVAVINSYLYLTSIPWTSFSLKKKRNRSAGSLITSTLFESSFKKRILSEAEIESILNNDV